MIAALIWGSCGAPVQDGWELDPLVETVDAPTEEVVDLPTGVSSGILRDGEEGLWVDVPSGWRAWPGAPDSSTRMHLEHALTGATVQIHRLEVQEEWPARNGCDWTLSVNGLSSGLKHRGAIDSAVCWPDVPGDSRLLAWRFASNQSGWLVEAKIPGGSAGLVDEALDALLPSLSFE